ncbi:hypothetical protein DO66_2819 [Burkholderia pseudomallei]|nr:hypothetical protein DO66_2819 [Burkholderia pseudomallei]
MRTRWARCARRSTAIERARGRVTAHGAARHVPDRACGDGHDEGGAVRRGGRRLAGRAKFHRGSPRPMAVGGAAVPGDGLGRLPGHRIRQTI